MPGQGGAVGENGIVAHHAVVGDMHIGHDPVVITDVGNALVLHRATTDGAVLADHIAIADLQASILALEFLVLGITADGGEGIDLVVPADAGWTFDHRMGTDTGSRTDLHMGADNGEGADTYAFGKAGGRINDSLGMDQAKTLVLSLRARRTSARRCTPHGHPPWPRR